MTEPSEATIQQISPGNIVGLFVNGKIVASSNPNVRHATLESLANAYNFVQRDLPKVLEALELCLPYLNLCTNSQAAQINEALSIIRAAMGEAK